MDLHQTVQSLGKSPLDYLDSECPLALGAFLFGYKTVDAGAGPVMDEFLRRIPGPDQADGCTRGYLAYGAGTAGFRRTVEILQETVEQLQPRPVASMAAKYAFIEAVRDPIESGKTGMAFAEPTVVWLANYYRGFLAGLASVAPASAREATASLHRFETWLRRRYQQPITSWHGLIRVFEGAAEHGLRRFVELWDEFESS
ncbi:MAG: hypothetical protein OEY14_09285 [Myxococcales bacterium]|nr:hypothetical protein [Myxococcales bacterium]